MLLEKQPSVPEKWEYLIPVLAIASFIISCVIISSKKYFWTDELESYYLLSDPSFGHMLIAFSDKFTNTPPLYFLLGWLWAKVFGSTELSLRIFSSLGICLACVTIWITLRRNYNFWSASIGTLGVFCTSNVILEQNPEARMYGLFLAVCSLGILGYDIINKSLKCSWIQILVNACIHIAIVQTHIFGLFYSGAILSAFVIRDRYFHRFRPKIYLSIVLSWSSLIFYVRAFLNQADAGNPRSWLPTPHRKELFDYFSSNFSLPLELAIFCIITLSVLQFAYKFHNSLEREDFDSYQQSFVEEVSILILAYALISVPILAWIISKYKPIFLNRYLIPSTISWSILLAYLSSHLISRISIFKQSLSISFGSFKFLFREQQLILLTLIVILLSRPISYAHDYPQQQLPGSSDNFYEFNEVPFVLESSNEFLRRFHYSPNRSKYFFLLDWQAALDKRNGLFSPQEYKVMDALKRSYPNLFHNNIVQSKDFLSIYDRFLYSRAGDVEFCTPQDSFCSKWLEVRIKDSSSHKVEPLNKQLFLVFRK